MSLLLAIALLAVDPLAPLPPATAKPERVAKLATAKPEPVAKLATAKPEPGGKPVLAERLVRRGEPVTLRLRDGAITIVTAGRALGDGARGARVRVIALATRRTLEGVVEGPGEIRILKP